jgi:hypothetical protein
MNGEPRRIEGFPEGANVPFFPETPQEFVELRRDWRIESRLVRQYLFVPAILTIGSVMSRMLYFHQKTTEGLATKKHNREEDDYFEQTKRDA